MLLLLQQFGSRQSCSGTGSVPQSPTHLCCPALQHVQLKLALSNCFTSNKESIIFRNPNAK